MKKIVSVILAGAMCASLLTACSGSSASGGSNTSSAQTTASKSTITIGILSDLSSFDPQNHNDTVSAYATRHIYNNLVKLTDDNEFVGNLAKSWGVSG